MNESGAFEKSVMQDRRTDRRLHAGLTGEVDVQLGRRQPEVGYELGWEHCLKRGKKIHKQLVVVGIKITQLFSPNIA